jgi:hypothetical protein
MIPVFLYLMLETKIIYIYSFMKNIKKLYMLQYVAQ